MATTSWLLQEVGGEVGIKLNHVRSKQNCHFSVDDSAALSFIRPFIFLTINHKCAGCKSLTLATEGKVLSRVSLISDIKQLYSSE